MKQLLKNKDFLFLWAGQSISNMGDWITIITLLILIYKLSASPIAVSILLLIRLLPQVLIAPWAGAIIDRCNKKYLMIICDLLRAIFVACLASATDIFWIYIFAGATSVCTIFFQPSLKSLIPACVDRRDLVQANSVLSISYNAAMIAGPTLSGFVIAWKGIPFTFYIDSATFILSVVSLLFIGAGAAVVKTEAPRRLTEDIASGFKYIKSNRTILNIILLSALTFLGIGSLYALEIVYASEILMLDSSRYGLIVASAGVGVLAGSFLLTSIGKKINEYLSFMAGIFIFGLSLLAFTYTISFLAAFIILFVEGIGEALFTITSQTILQKESSDGIRGRVFSIHQMACHATTLTAVLLSGIIATYTGAGNVMKAGALIIILAGAIGYASLSRRRCDQTATS